MLRFSLGVGEEMKGVLEEVGECPPLNAIMESGKVLFM